MLNTVFHSELGASFLSLVSRQEIQLALLAGALLLGSIIIFILYRQSAVLRRRLHAESSALTEAGELLAQAEEQLTREKVKQARLVALIRTERRTSAEKLTLIKEAKDELRLQFANLAQEIFEQKSATFTSQSKEKLDAMLQPFHQQLDALQGEIRETYLNDTRERASLKKELHQLHELNRQLGKEATDLTRALKGDKKLQGNWGELILEKVLEQSGLRRGVEYTTQEGYRDAENKLFKPDVVIHLPDSKEIIIDAKVSLVSWERYCSTEDEQIRAQALKELVTAIRNHISSLGSKNYEELEGIRSLDFILMFLPIEAAFSTAVSADHQLLTEAFKTKIVLVTPTTLLATLRTVESLWRYEHQSRNAQEIARRAGALYDKFRGFVEDMERVGKQIDSSRQSWEGAMNKLTTGRGNLISQAHQLTELGVQVKKELSRSVRDKAEVDQHEPPQQKGLPPETPPSLH